MALTLTLLPADVETPHARIRPQIEAVVTAQGGSVGPEGDVRAADGVVFRLDESTVAITTLSPAVCRIIFDAALRTNTYVLTTTAGPLKMKGSPVRPPKAVGRVEVLRDPVSLCARLKRAQREWNAVVRQAQEVGIMGADGGFLVPPGDPGDEPRFTGQLPADLARCKAATEDTASHIGEKIVRSVVTVSLKWGVVWRADMGDADQPELMFRQICWLARGPDGAAHSSLMAQPLRMGDPSLSLKPLKAD